MGQFIDPNHQLGASFAIRFGEIVAKPHEPLSQDRCLGSFYVFGPGWIIIKAL